MYAIPAVVRPRELVGVRIILPDAGVRMQKVREPDRPAVPPGAKLLKRMWEMCLALETGDHGDEPGSEECA
eukprot:15203684-Alexandrium_andersonii.AAC.1